MPPPTTTNLEEQAHLSFKEKLDRIDRSLARIVDYESIVSAESNPVLKKMYLDKLEFAKNLLMNLRNEVKKSHFNLFKKTPSSSEITDFQTYLDSIINGYVFDSNALQNMIEDNRQRFENMNTSLYITQPGVPDDSPQSSSAERPQHERMEEDMNTDTTHGALSSADRDEEHTQDRTDWGTFPVPRTLDHYDGGRHREGDEEEWRHGHHRREVSVVVFEGLSPRPRPRNTQPYEDPEAREGIDGNQAGIRPPQRGPRPFSETFGPHSDVGHNSSALVEDGHENVPARASPEECNYSIDDDDMYVSDDD